MAHLKPCKSAEVPEEVNDPDRVLESLDAGVDQDTIEAPIMEIDVILVMLVEGVGGFLLTRCLSA